MVEKIKAAREAAQQEGMPDLIINGRTDALSVAADRSEGVNESIARANLYLRRVRIWPLSPALSRYPEVKTLVDWHSRPSQHRRGTAE